MKYILDSNVAFKWEVPEQDTDKALRLRDAYRAIRTRIARINHCRIRA